MGLIILKVENREIQLKINSIEALVDGEKVELDVHTTILNGRTLVPLRFISECFQNEIKAFQIVKKPGLSPLSKILL